MHVFFYIKKKNKEEIWASLSETNSTNNFFDDVKRIRKVEISLLIIPLHLI